MKVLVNNIPTDVSEAAMLSTLLQQLNLPSTGIAVAVNNKMIPRQQWDSYQLQPDDTLVIIKAACGG